MINLFAAMRSSADALAVFSRALAVTENNVTNASTPGYVRQIQGLEALEFDPEAGIVGGVGAARIQSARDIYAEQAVRREAESMGRWQEQVDALAELESGFDLSGKGGIAGALSGMYRSFSAWSVAPNDDTARQNVIEQAGAAAQAFQQASRSFGKSAQDADSRLVGLVDQVNSLAGKLRDFNVQRRGVENENPGIEAGVYSALEQLSEIGGISVLRQDDGSLTVLLNGQTPLVVGEFQYRIAAGFSTPATPTPVYASGPPPARLTDASGRDITAETTGGRLGGLLQFRNRTLAALRGDPYQPGALNRLAKAVADTVNQIFTSGVVSNGPPPVPGVPLFVYDATNDTNAAQSLTVDPTVTTAQLAAASAGPPYQSNGTILQLAGLAAPQGASGKIDNLSFTQFYGGLAARVGRDAATARDQQTVQKDLLAQARSLRQQSSGVSLDEEAIHVLEFQRAFQATAKLVTTLDEMTQTVINLLP